MTTDEPQVWHYGLMAERWAEFNNEAREVPFLLQVIRRFGQPVLDVTCGTGRLQLPLLQAGVDVDGCDISADMLAHCALKADRAGFHPNLYQQAMDALELPRRYRTVYLCDAFGLAGSRARDLETLRRCYAALEDSGALVVNIQAEYTSRDSWEWWLSAGGPTAPEPWPEEGHQQVAADGTVYVDRFRIVEADPLEQSYTRQVRLEKWRDGQQLAAEEYTLRGGMYLKNEMLLMLQVAGFREITLSGDYTDRPAAAADGELVFLAVR